MKSVPSFAIYWQIWLPVLSFLQYQRHNEFNKELYDSKTFEYHWKLIIRFFFSFLFKEVLSTLGDILLSWRHFNVTEQM